MAKGREIKVQEVKAKFEEVEIHVMEVAVAVEDTGQPTSAEKIISS